ncbi:leucine-rich repeat domain-containing protein [Bremerella sp. P1]|uniref:leucine-rich repeat domain-containing protein n=1 Tax=Bremerella sp. P1 TaxID=3026424 RepID=UPI0023677CC1|nr:hypothetical protein [Bremerella sp. P1]WDI42921.1 hypothetical protein PSR63_03045 [Bremerella sp. P1]
MRRGVLSLLVVAATLTTFGSLSAQAPVAFPPVPIDVGGPMDPEIERIVATLEQSGCLFGYGASLSDEIVNWPEYGCIRVDGTKMQDDHWDLLLQLPSVKLLSLHNTPPAGNVRNCLRQMSELAELQLHNSLDDSGMSTIAELPSLQAIRIAETKISDHGIWYLEELQNLKHVELEQLPVTNQSFHYLKQLPRLNTLSVVDADLSGPWYLKTGDFPSLGKLTLEGEKITDEVAEQVSQMKGLVEVHFDRSNLTMTGLAQLAGMPNIEQISATNSTLEDAPCPMARPAAKLQSLDLSSTKTGDQFLSSMTNFPSLAELNLSGAKITDAGVSNLRNLKSLETLRLNNTEITSGGLASIASLPSLREIHLHGTKLNGDVLDHLTTVKTLEWIDLSNTNVSGEKISKLAELPNLRGVALFNTPINTSDLPYLRKLSHVDEVYVDGSQLTVAEQQQLREFYATAKTRLSR